MRKILGALALTTLFAIGTAVPASAGVASNVVGVEVCDVNLNLSVTWTFTNNTNGSVAIESASVNNSLLTSGSVTTVNVNMSPSAVPSLGTAVGHTFTASSPAPVGTLSITVFWFDAQNTSLQSTFSLLLVPCVAGPTTTAAPTTTAPATTAAPTTTATAVAADSGQLPHVGQGTGSLPWIALGLVGTGLALVSVRRRPRRV